LELENQQKKQNINNFERDSENSEIPLKRTNSGLKTQQTQQTQQTQHTQQTQQTQTISKPILKAESDDDEFSIDFSQHDDLNQYDLEHY